MQFIPALSPTYSEPQHLAPVVNVIEEIGRGKQVNVTIASAPRIEKSETVRHGLAWLLLQYPWLRICLVSYAAPIATRFSKRLLDLYTKARGPLDPKSRSAHDWRTGIQEGGVFASSIGGQLVSLGFDIIVIDDPIANRVAAESKLVRDRTFDWYTDVASTRAEPGCSTIVMHHRWHEDDLIGRLAQTGQFQEISLPAINADGSALCPERLSLAELSKKRKQMGDYGFESLYLQRPRPRGSMVFNGLTHYTTRPSGLTITIGVDFAYSLQSQRDYSAFVVLGSIGEFSFVIDLFRAQLDAPRFRDRLVTLKTKYLGAPMIAFIGGVEAGVLSLFAEAGLTIEARNANQYGDKYTRSQSCAAAWNDGKVLVPESAPWLEDFVSEVVSFTGHRGGKDDQVDSLVAAFEGVRTRATESNVKAPAPVFWAPQGASFEGVVIPSTIVNGGSYQLRSLQQIEHDELARWAGGPANGSSAPAPAATPTYSIIHTSQIGSRDPFDGF